MTDFDDWAREKDMDDRRFGRSSELIDLDLEIKFETEKALQVSDGTKYFWLPKSQIEYDEDDAEIGHTITIKVPEWLATEKGLV